MPKIDEEDYLIIKVEKFKARGQFYTLRLTPLEYDSFWKWKNAHYKKKPKRA